MARPLGNTEEKGSLKHVKDDNSFQVNKHALKCMESNKKTNHG